MLYIYSSFAVLIYGMTTKVLFNHVVGRLSIHVKTSDCQHHKAIHTVYKCHIKAFSKTHISPIKYHSCFLWGFIPPLMAY